MRAFLVGLALTLLAGPSLAANADCLWEATPAAERDALLASYDRDLGGLLKTQLPSDRIQALADACAVPQMQHGQIRDLVLARALETASGRYWARRTGRAFAIEQAWMSLSEEDKDQLRRWAATAIADGRGEEKYFDALPRFAVLMQATAPEMPHLIAFILGRGYRELMSD
ncbi:hypothetical protein GVN21_11265 [Caulobacter sp. SLTY]|uniref:hypothetical protein n=1 Tax=Caulobacter sp. SLTY TaxID=2683262 RepID=UPI0014132EA1|nr:hypothetical protein [Caulobacter sp. SLTY]NBB15934.1 hypothetical protein [Caulobacter sp. SLTY]